MRVNFSNLGLVQQDWRMIWFIMFLEKRIDSDFPGLKVTSHCLPSDGFWPGPSLTVPQPEWGHRQ